jgi:hypothetical protein
MVSKLQSPSPGSIYFVLWQMGTVNKREDLHVVLIQISLFDLTNTQCFNNYFLQKSRQSDRFFIDSSVEILHAFIPKQNLDKLRNFEI